jgi:ABC-type multidrug transport system ATPase subunit/pSer/pThr/pTyr-binding forkhead associated (FHA) protein
MKCPYCGSANVASSGKTDYQFRCRQCGKSFIPSQHTLSDAETGPASASGGRETFDHTLADPQIRAASQPVPEQRFLYCESGPLEGQSFPIRAEGLRVGRHPTKSQLVLDDPETSREHARVWVETVPLTGSVFEKVLIENLSTTNGTYVNDRRIDQAELQSGDRIRFGVNSPCVFVYRSGAAAPPAQASPRAEAQAGQTDRETHFVEAPAVRPVKTVIFREGEEAPPPNARFQLILDQYAVRDIPLTSSRVAMGSAAGPGKVQIEHPTVSELHAELIFGRAGTAVLHDRNSKNGTFVNGERIQERVLREGDVIQLGGCDTKLLLYREARRRTMALRATDLKKDVVKLGRAQDNDIKLDHPTVSQHHAEIRRRGDGYELADRNSTNGTFVNGARVSKHRLQPRDRISIGAVQLFFDGSSLEQQSDGNQVRLYAYGLRYAPPNEPGKVLIQNVSLAIEPREFIGLLGPSGAGKTTLMHALNGSQPAQVGRVMMNGSSVYDEYEALRSAMGYLPQEDILHRALTVRQCLYFAAKLRLPDDFGEQEIWKRIAEVLLVLDLKERADLPIVMLSGGQRKRVSLGIELLSKPALLFMDEPTAGQDPRTEMHMMRLFREIANRGSTIVCTTHLLGSFSLLDKIAVLVAGRLAYYGPSQEMLPYFHASRPHEVYETLQGKPPEAWEGEFQKSQVYRENVANPLGEEKKPSRQKAPAPARRPAAAAPSLLRQFTTLLERQFTLRLSDWKNTLTLLAPPALVGLMAVALKSEPNEPKVLFITVFTALYFACSVAVGEIVNELPVYQRERRQNLSMTAYLGSKIVYLACVGAVQSLLFLTILTALGGQSNHFFGALGLMWLIAFQGALIGLLLSAMFRTAEKPLFLFPLVMIVQLMLAGLLQPVEKPSEGFVIHPQTGEIENLQAPPEGMGGAVKFFSALTVARWGLESLADLYAHDFDAAGGNNTENKYSALNLNSITITFHRDDLRKARERFETAMAMKSAAARGLPQYDTRSRGLIPAPRTDLGKETAVPQYLAVHMLFVVLMIGLTAAALKTKDRS